MKKPQEPLQLFECPNLGYDIAFIPRSKKDRARLELKAEKKGMPLSEFAREEIVAVMALAEMF
jgi:hypothetical protein